ncbi:b-glycosidase [Sphingomonas parva]|uniref:B-glycosidase n=1 Tax=Sphingomonas parva TaxID=2555898 RepID=A0A4Y8ZPD4_9SPHN|nr:b-glycosidase [Sphingomonas parva]TFI57881.1 b-glycosidase [Sphingomonas parva]
MNGRQALFPTFFLSGFECSTFLWKDAGRRDLCAETQHQLHADEDYRLLRSLGIAVAREGIPWPMVDRRGRYCFGCIDAFLDAQRRHDILPIWDLCHYGYPDDLDPFGDDFAPRFAAYARAAAEYVTARAHHGPAFFTPMNEITFFGYMAGEWGWAAPFGRDRETRRRLTLAMCKADIAAVKAIREVVPDARMIHIDPLILVVPPRDRPDLADEAWRETYDDAFFAFDVIGGRRHPEAGGAPDVLDIVGFNNYSFGQMEYRPEGPHAALEPGDPRIRPLCDLIEEGWKRYGRPTIVAETSGLKGGRPDWLNDVVSESLAAVNRGVDLHGICLFPAVDMPDWHNGEWLHNGIADLERLPDGSLMRTPYPPYVEALRRWQHRLNRVTELDAVPYDSPVNLADIVAAAKAVAPRPDDDWH